MTEVTRAYASVQAWSNSGVNALPNVSSRAWINASPTLWKW